MLFISENKLARIMVYMNDEHRETIHRLYAPCSASKFLYEYVKRYNDINKVLFSEFNINPIDVEKNSMYELGEFVCYKDKIAKVSAVKYIGSQLTSTKYRYDIEIINKKGMIYNIDEGEIKSLDESIILDGYTDTWSRIEKEIYCSSIFKLFLNDKYGDETFYIFTDEFNNPIDETYEDLLTTLRRYYG